MTALVTLETTCDGAGRGEPPSRGAFDALLASARARQDAAGGAYAGAVTPPEAWQLFASGYARLVDVRTAAEVHYVGRVPGASHIEWHGNDPAQVRRFLTALGDAVGSSDVVLFLCRSAVRSHHAATVACAAGYAQVFNVLEGFEGQRNHAQQRGHIDGWRKHGLPWIQD